jgi:hypothetical protein
MGRLWKMLITMSFVLTGVGMLVTGSFVGALHDPTPNRLNVAVVGPAQALGSLMDSPFTQREHDAIALQPYASEAEARSAILSRNLDGAIVLDPPNGQTLIFAGAAGRFSGQVLTNAFEAEAGAAGQRFTVRDIDPLPAQDLNGISGLYFIFGIALSSVIFGVAIARTIGRRLNPFLLLAIYSGFSLLVAAGTTWVVDGMVGALTTAPAAIFAVGALLALGVSTVSGALGRSVGIPGAAAFGLLVISIGMPAAGGPFGSSFIPSWYSHLGSELPVGAGVPAIRNISYFDGNTIGYPLTVLALWAGLGLLALSAMGLLAQRKRSAGGTTVQAEAGTVGTVAPLPLHTLAPVNARTPQIAPPAQANGGAPPNA